MNQCLIIYLAFPLLIFGVSTFKVQKIPLQTVDLGTVTSENFGVKIWQHEGFDHMSGLQINEKFNLRVSVTPKLLVASGETPAHLQTILKNYDHTFLIIKFSTIIGKVSNEGPKPEPNSFLNTTTEIVTGEVARSSTENKHDEKEKSSNPALIPTQAPKVTKEAVSASLNASSTKTDDPEKVKKTKGAIIRAKRNIDISSQELLQIHKIIKMAKKVADTENKTLEDSASLKKGIVDLKSTEYTERSITDTPPTEMSSVMKDDIIEDLKNASVDVKLTYKAWRASFDRSYRPPGFYFLVDDHVIYDNWYGIWNNPNVLGRATPHSLKRTWNETEIQFQWDEPPKRDFKISFEWDPVEKGSFILIDNIEISTFGVSPEIPMANQNGNNVGNTQSNNNLTVYIVVKPAPGSQSHETTIVGNSITNLGSLKEGPSDNKISHLEGKKDSEMKHPTDSENEKKLADDLLELIKKVKLNETKENETKSTGKDKIAIAITTPKPETPRKAKENKVTAKNFTDDKTGLIVLIVFIVMGSLILIALLHRKFKEDRNPNRMGNRC